MIRLIASDMDGTLLDGRSEVPAETYDLIRALREKGVRFVVSSGRRYDRLRMFFEPVAEEIDYVASNGTQVYAEGRLIDREVYSHLAIKRLLYTVSLFGDMHLALFDRTKSYLLDDEKVFIRELDKDLPNIERIWDVPEPDVNILKACIFCDGNVMDCAYVLSRELGDEFVFAPSGEHWVDAIQRGVSKATGVRQVMEHYGICADEVTAFGDSMNDYEIIRMVGDGCAMENARPALKAVANRIIGSNIEHGVQAEMRRLLETL